jgi:hypothetical protein
MKESIFAPSGVSNGAKTRTILWKFQVFQKLFKPG